MEPKLFMIMLGCKPAGRHTEQHDIFFTIAGSIEETRTAVLNFWPEAKGRVHMDAWREVSAVDGYEIRVITKDTELREDNKLFFINLGGYTAGVFDEPHYKMLIVAEDLAAASKKAKESAFYQHAGFQGAPAHIDDKYGVDVDDAFEILEILNPEQKETYKLQITRTSSDKEDMIHLGYMPLYKK